MPGLNLEILLLPTRVVVRRKTGRKYETVSEAQMRDDLSWHQPLEYCRAHLVPGSKLNFVFSDLWARYDLVMTGEARLGNEEAKSLAQAHFGRDHPDCAAWPLRIASAGPCLIAAGMDPELLEAMTLLAASCDATLSGAEPLFSRIFDPPADYEGWFVLDEPGMTITGYVERGNPLSLQPRRRSENETVSLVLERQAALLGKSSRQALWFACPGRLSLPAPWQGREIASPFFCGEPG